MERFVFVVAVAFAIIFGIVAVFGGPMGSHFNFEIDSDHDGRGTAEVVAVSPGSMAAQTFAGGDLRIRNIAAIVTITPEDRTDYSIEIDNNAGQLPMPTVAADDGRVIVDGQLRGRVRDCRRDGGATVRGYGDGDFDAAELPHVTIRTPRAVKLDRSGAGQTNVGASASAQVDIAGCGAVTLADVQGALELDIAGAGDVTTGAAGSLDADIAGAGDITLGAISGGADFDISGAGNVTIASLTGDFTVDSAGASDITINDGSIATARIDMAGTGDIDIAAPVQTLNASIMGVGHVDVAGTVGDLDVDIAGPGSLTVQAVTGSMRQEIAGPGSVRVTGTAARANPAPENAATTSTNAP
ncbi:MAG: DUF2807 domain-containing protein [Terricaulis sp.]